MTKTKIKKGDEVMVITGRDKGKKGSVLRVMREEGRLVVAGVHMAKRHKKADQAGAGGITEKELSIHISNVALIDPKDDKPTRIGYKTLKDGKKVRFAKRSGEVLAAS